MQSENYYLALGDVEHIRAWRNPLLGETKPEVAPPKLIPAWDFEYN